MCKISNKLPVKLIQASIKFLLNSRHGVYDVKI